MISVTIARPILFMTYLFKKILSLTCSIVVITVRLTCTFVFYLLRVKKKRIVQPIHSLVSYLPFLYNFRISGFTVVNDFKMFFTICQGYFSLSASCINAVFLHFSPFLCRDFISFCRIYIHCVFHTRQNVRLIRTPVFPTSALGFCVFAALRHFNQNGRTVFS